MMFQKSFSWKVERLHNRLHRKKDYTNVFEEYPMCLLHYI